ncbi:unnamed protein product [Linum trigynum]|uniref:Uncharacterized protein n=1 Tax=Linum trigynum TaxID=586398 RepID=A0AAV2FC17_9ROSI
MQELRLPLCRVTARKSTKAVEFLSKWLNDHEEFKSNSVCIGGDSYAGILIPGVALRFANENEQGMKPAINLMGYLVGNGVTNATIEHNSKIKFAHGMALIPDELHECISGLQQAQILSPHCAYASPRPTMMARRTSRSLEELLELETEPLPTLGCPTFAYLLALHVRKGTIGTWESCSSRLHYTYDIPSSIEFHLQLARKGNRSLIYSGDHDMIVLYVGTLEWIRSLNFRIVEEWRHWLLNNQVAGTYSDPRYFNLMTFATVKGAGHTVPEYKPPECFAMFRRWITGEPL